MNEEKNSKITIFITNIKAYYYSGSLLILYSSLLDLVNWFGLVKHYKYTALFYYSPIQQSLFYKVTDRNLPATL